MEDDYQATLRGKIKILYQLEKWQDVSKLCRQFNEQYGKDAEIDQIRFKTDRNLGMVPPARDIGHAPPMAVQKTASPARDGDDADAEEPLLLLSEENEARSGRSGPVENAAPPTPPADEDLDYEPFPQANELVISGPVGDSDSIFNPDLNESSHDAPEPMIVDPSAENEPVLSLDYSDAPPAANTLMPDASAAEKGTGSIIIDAEPGPPSEPKTDAPFSEYEPVFSLSGHERPVVLEESPPDGNGSAGLELQEDELAIIGATEASPVESVPPAAFSVAAPTILAPEAASQPVAEEKPSPLMPLPEGEIRKVPEPPPAPDIGERPAQVWQVPEPPAPRDFEDERNLHARDSSASLQRKPEPAKKFTFKFKYLAVLILPLAAAVFLWLALSGKLTRDGDDLAEVTPAQVRPARKPAARRPAAKAPAAVPLPEDAEKVKRVDEKIRQAQGMLENGDAVNALAVVLEAKKIMETEPLSQLEKKITERLRDDATRAAEQKSAAIAIVRSEEQDYADAVTEDTVAALEKFLARYPMSSYAARARAKIAAIEKAAAQKAELEFQQRVRQSKRRTLRSDYVNLNQADLNSALQKLGQAGPQFETLARGNEKVVVDFSSGLMWYLYSKPMTFDKASWWANRNYAGYSGWRLPTIEESQMLQRMDPAIYGGLRDFAVWTGDGVSDITRSAWVFKPSSGQFSPEKTDMLYYVWAVRRAAK
jgi:hypothetical protein